MPLTPSDLQAVTMLDEAIYQGMPGALVVGDELNDAFGRAFVRRHRSRRLHRRARRLSRGGFHRMAELAGAAASVEMSGAVGDEWYGTAIVRHTYGTFTASEMRQLKRQAFFEKASAGEAEAALRSIQERLMKSASGYGAADDSETPELDTEAYSELSELVDAFGGDMSLVFGEEVYDRLGAMVGASQDRLKKRLARLQKRLEKLEQKLEDKEDAGKSGLGVKILTKRIDWLENRIEKIRGKITDGGDASDAIEAAREESTDTDRAEASSVSRDDEEPALNLDQIEADLDKDLDDLESMGAECALYGMTPRRRARILKRIARLERRLDRAEDRKQTRGRIRRLARVRKRLARLKLKLQQQEDDMSLDVSDSSDFSTSLVPVEPGAYTQSEFIDSFFGADRQPFVGYFARHADAGRRSNAPGPRFAGQFAAFSQQALTQQMGAENYLQKLRATIKRKQPDRQKKRKAVRTDVHTALLGLKHATSAGLRRGRSVVLNLKRLEIVPRVQLVNQARKVARFNEVQKRRAMRTGDNYHQKYLEGSGDEYAVYIWNPLDDQIRYTSPRAGHRIVTVEADSVPGRAILAKNQWQVIRVAVPREA